MVKRYSIILIDRSVNAGIVGFSPRETLRERVSTQPTGGNPTTPNTSIWHNGGEENNISIGTSQSLANLDSSQVSTGQVSLVKNGVQMNSTINEG